MSTETKEVKNGWKVLYTTNLAEEPKSWYKYKRYIHPNNTALRTLANATKAGFTGEAGDEEADAPH